MSRRLSRRALIEWAVAFGSAVAGGWPRIAAADDQEIAEKDKIKQTDAQYRQQPKGQQRCEICLQFEAPNKCKIV